MEFLGQPDSPDPPEADERMHDNEVEYDLDLHGGGSDGLLGEFSTGLENPLEEPAATPDPISSSSQSAEPAAPAPEVKVDFLRGLTGSELTPGVAALLKRMLEEKSKKEAMLVQIKGLMTWDTLNEEIRSFFPEIYLDSLADWALTSMQSEVIRQGILDQNRKEHEYYKKRENMTHDQQRELTLMKKRHHEALQDCDMKNTPHRKPIVAKSNEEELHKLVLKQEEELYTFDRKIVLAIDHLLASQQKKFQDIGIPGMKETTVSQEILQQMIVIDVIARLAGVDSQVM